MVVMPDADLDMTVDALMGAGYGSAGERCMAISVAVPVGDKVADALVERLAPACGSSRSAGTRSPASRWAAWSRPSTWPRCAATSTSASRKVRSSSSTGATRMQGYENGYFLGGCLFDRVTTDMRIYQEEIFGPVLSVARAKSFDEAVGMVNGHEYGNGTAIFTRDGDAARTFANAVNIGMVGVNIPIPVPLSFHSFGGWKRSLFATTTRTGWRACASPSSRRSRAAGRPASGRARTSACR